MRVNNPPIPSEINPATPPSSPEKGVVATFEKTTEETTEEAPETPEEASTHDTDTDTIKPASTCPPSVQPPDWVTKGLRPSPGPSYKYMDANRFLEDRAPGDLHQWPPRPNVVKTVTTLEHDMRIAIIPEIQLPITNFHVYENGTVKIEGRFARDIYRLGVTGRYSKSSTSFGEKLARIKRVVRGKRRKDGWKEDGIRDKVKTVTFQTAMARWENEGGSRRPVLGRVSAPRQKFAFVNGARVPQKRVHFPELNVPEVVVDGNDVLWKEDSILIQGITGRKILANATLFIPDDFELLRDIDKMSSSMSFSEEEAVIDESTLSEVDILRYQLSRGRWMWIYHTNRLHDPDINTGLTEDYELARYYHVLKNDTHLLQKLCSGIPFTRNDRILLHSYGIEKFHITPLLTYATILVAKEEKHYSPIEPGIEIEVPSTAKINCVQESRITQTLLGQRPVKPPPPISFIAIPEEESIETPPSEQENSSPPVSPTKSTKSSKGKEKEKEPSALAKLGNQITALLKSHLKEKKGKKAVRPPIGVTYHRRPHRRPRPILRDLPNSHKQKSKAYKRLGRSITGRPIKSRANSAATARSEKFSTSPIPSWNMTMTVPAPQYLNMCPPCSDYASGSHHSPIDCTRPFRNVDWSWYPDPIEPEEESDSESVRRLLSMRPRIKVERCVFVRVRGGSVGEIERGMKRDVGERSGSEVDVKRLEGETETRVEVRKMGGGRIGEFRNEKVERVKLFSNPQNSRPGILILSKKSPSNFSKAKSHPRVHFLSQEHHGKRLPMGIKRGISI